MNRYPESYQPEKEQAEPLLLAQKFLAFRHESARALNEEVCEPFLNGMIKDEQIAEYFQADPEMVKIIRFTLESFAKPQDETKLWRKDGSSLAAHSLQLFLSARDCFQVSDKDVLQAVLDHDIIEDTAVTRSEIAAQLGEKAAELAEAMTEESLREPLPALDKQSLVQLSQVRFVEKMKRGGSVIALAEIIDRCDDVSDTAYVTNGLDGSLAALAKAKEKFAYKFAKCLYTIQSLCDGAEDATVKRLASFPAALVQAKLAEIGKDFGINITDQEIADEISSFKALEEV